MSHRRDWSKYNKSLVNRGDLTFWIHKKSLKLWKAKKNKHRRGAPFIYSDMAIQTAMIVKYALKLTYRALEGYLKYLFKILGIDLAVPCYTQICKRMKSLELPRHLLINKAVKHIVIDATGLKVYGEGEWKVKKHGASKRRVWRKMHLAVDEQTQEILFVDLTTEHICDTIFVPEIMEKRRGIKKVLMDGAADAEDLYKLAWESEIDLLTPPKKTAIKRPEPWMKKRTNRLLEIRGLGGDAEAKSLWGKLSGYSKRVTVESAIARWKRLFSGHLESREDKRQHVESRLKSLMINNMRKQELLIG